MADMTAFERQVGDEIFRIVGPARPVDDLAVYEAVIATDRQKGWGVTMFSAFRFVVAGAIVALFGGFLLTGALTTQRGDEMVPAADPATTGEVAPFHAVPDGSVVVWGTASCEISLGGEVSTEGEYAFLVVCELDMSDPRVSGTERQDHFRLLAGEIGAGAVWVLEEAVLTNDEGTWRGSVQAAEDAATLPAGEVRYVGEGAYEGLEFNYYFLSTQDADHAVVRGWISPISEPPAE